MNDPVMSLKSLLEDNWVPANTSSITPDISTGWYDLAAKRPVVTLTDPVDTPVSNGQVKFFGIVQNGSPNQYMMSTLALNVWVTRTTATMNPKQLRFEFVQEIQRILLAKFEDITDLDFVAWGGGFGQVDSKTKPPTFRYIAEVQYGYLKCA